MTNTVTSKDIKKEKRNRLLSALFAKANKMGIEQEFLRDTIAQNIIGKRLSEASSKEIFKVIEHLVKVSPSPATLTPTLSQRERERGTRGEEVKRYESSRKGLLLELTDAAKARWGTDFEKPLNAFVNSHLKVPTHYKFLNVATMKAVKERLREMNQQRDSSASPQNDSIGRGV